MFLPWALFCVEEESLLKANITRKERSLKNLKNSELTSNPVGCDLFPLALTSFHEGFTLLMSLNPKDNSNCKGSAEALQGEGRAFVSRVLIRNWVPFLLSPLPTGP